MKRFVKYTSRIIIGVLVLFMGLLTYYAYTPDESYHHCEAEQNDGNPIYVAFIAIASLLVFCFVWYKTKDLCVNKEGKDNPKELPEPFKTWVEFDNYMSELTWVKIESEGETAPQSGFYLFNCLGDNHTFYEFYELEEKDKLCKYYLDHHFDGWAVVKPIEYHIVEDAEGEYLMKNWGWNDNSMIFAPQNDEPIRLADGNLYKDGELLRIEKGFKWIIGHTLLELRKIASRNNCQTIKDIQQIEVMSSYGHSYRLDAQQIIEWEKYYFGLIDCTDKEKEHLITFRDPRMKQSITKLLVYNDRAHFYDWSGKDGSYSYTGNTALNMIANEVEEDVYNEHYKCKDEGTCRFLEYMKNNEIFSYKL